MKKKGYLVSLLLLLIISCVTVTACNKTKDQTQNSEETKLKNQALSKETIESSNKKLSKRNADSFSLDLKNASAERLYETFNGSNADEIIALLEMNHDDSDRILVTTDGTILTGQLGDENGRKVDTNTDKNSITVKELKDLVLKHKEKIDELAAKDSSLE
ncbi:hypothetical protein CI088_07235 [Enterococcus plantarum]|uniref:Lipoprotein n=1 Tax=Enterococcus plantarum TaxID=1077675 RepID=A0A2W3Z369_9ENTE|nr:hypothetical protein [Enterococcus plantarum]PZL74236.1 hypothetical protein CI088_07235 [Enterococcus plantarum]